MSALPKRPGFLRRKAGIFLAFALLGLIVHDILGPHGLLAMRRSQKELENLRQEIQQINENNRRLAEQVKGLKSDPRLIERIAREEMGLARPGELIFKLPSKPAEPSRPEPPRKK